MPEFEGGGRAIGFASSLTIRLRRGDWITVGTGQNKAIIGQQVKFKINKSKVSVPQRTGMWDVYLDDGGTVPKGHIDTFKETVIEAIAYGIIERSGAWYYYEDLKENGVDNLVKMLRDTPKVYEEIREKTMNLALSASDDTLEKFKASLSEEESALYAEYGTIDREAIAKMEEIEEKPVKKTTSKIKGKRGAKSLPKKGKVIK